MKNGDRAGYPRINGLGVEHHGFTKREAIAKDICAALFSVETTLVLIGEGERTGQEVCRKAVFLADALLEALEEKCK